MIYPSLLSFFLYYLIRRFSRNVDISQTSKTPHLLNIIIRQRAPVLQLLSGEDQTLLVGRDALLVLDLGFDIVDCVGGFDFEGDGFARESFNEAFFWERFVSSVFFLLLRGEYG